MQRADLPTGALDMNSSRKLVYKWVLGAFLLGLVFPVASWVIALLTFAWAAGPVTTNDLYWHLNTGELLWTAGELAPRKALLPMSIS